MKTPGLGAAWAVLIGTGITSVTFNVVHAVPVLELALALLLGFAPAFVAACLSHVAAVLDAPPWVKLAVIAVMGAGMVLSASATAAVVSPADPGWRGWLFGVTLDGAALLALWAVFGSRRAKAAAMEETETLRTEAAEATARADGLASELASVRAELEASREATAEAISEPEAKPPSKPRAMPGAVAKEPEAVEARAAYRRSVRAGKPLSDRALGAMFDRGRTWGGNRIEECQVGPKLAEAK